MEKSKKNFMSVLVFFCIILVFAVVPTPNGITAEGMRLIGLFFAFIFGMTVTDDPWPALFTLVLFPLTGLVTMADVLVTGVGNDTFVFVLFSLFLISYLESSGAAKFVTTWLLQRKMLLGHPYRLLFMLFFICWLLSAFVNAVAGLLIIWSFLYEIFHCFGYKAREKTSTIIMFGTCVTAAIGLASLPWGNNSLVILNAFTNMTGESVNYLVYMGFSLPFAMMVIGIYLFLCRFVFRLDVSAMKAYDPSIFDRGALEMTAEKKVALLSMVVLVVLILVPNCFPATSVIGRVGALFGLSGKLILIFAVLQILRVDGAPVFNFSKLSKAGSNWNLMLLVADILVFSSLISNEKAGISTFLTNALSPVFDNKPAVLLIIIGAIITVIITNMMINKIVGVLMISITLPIATRLGIDSVQLVSLYTVACTIAFMLPSASQASTVFFANAEWARPKDIFAYGLMTIVPLTIVCIGWNLLYFGLVH